LNSFFLHLDFVESHGDSLLFIFNKDGYCCYLLVYIDNVIIMGNNNSFVASIISKLAAGFSLRDLGALSYFLSIEVPPPPKGILLSQ
jgi:hypothetical protein